MRLNGTPPMIWVELRRARRLRRWQSFGSGLGLATIAWAVAAALAVVEMPGVALSCLLAAAACDGLRRGLVPCRHCGHRGRHALTCSGRTR